jgi:hypothetical protein
VSLYLDRLPPISEQDADAAFLRLSRLRDRLVGANEHIAACRVDEAIEKLEEACRVLRTNPVGRDPVREVAQ